MFQIVWHGSVCDSFYDFISISDYSVQTAGWLVSVASERTGAEAIVAYPRYYLGTHLVRLEKPR
jgi:hypothetical protein